GGGGDDAEDLLHEPPGGGAGPAVGEGDTVAGGVVGLQVDVGIGFRPGGVVGLPETGSAFVDHAAPVGANPREGVGAVAHAREGIEDVGAVVGRDDVGTIRGPVDVGKDAVPDGGVLRGSG